MHIDIFLKVKNIFVYLKFSSTCFRKNQSQGSSTVHFILFFSRNSKNDFQIIVKTCSMNKQYVLEELFSVEMDMGSKTHASNYVATAEQDLYAIFQFKILHRHTILIMHMDNILLNIIPKINTQEDNRNTKCETNND